MRVRIRVVMLTLVLWGLFVSACGGVKHRANVHRHLLVEPIKNAESLLGRQVTRRADGGFEIADSTSPGCQVVVRTDSSVFKEKEHQDVRNIAGTNLSIGKVFELNTKLDSEMRMETTVVNQQLLTADLSGTCGDNVILSVYVGTGSRTFQRKLKVKGGGGGGWQQLQMEGGSEHSNELATEFSWGELQAWAFTTGSVVDVNTADISISMPETIASGDGFEPVITAGNSDIWPIVFSCNENQQCKLHSPTSAIPATVVPAGQSVTLPSIAASGIADLPSDKSEGAIPVNNASRIRFIVYGFPAKGDFKTFAPPRGNLSIAQITSYAQTLATRLQVKREIPSRRWSRSEFNYVVTHVGKNTDETNITTKSLGLNQSNQPNSALLNKGQAKVNQPNLAASQTPLNTNPSSALEWVSIPGGTFKMGSRTSVSASERPVHSVTIGSFELLRTEVTVGQYRACVIRGSCSEPQNHRDSKNCNWTYSDRENHPVNCVDWHQARAFCQWSGGRLASEAQWEYAARSAGGDWVYPWGNTEATCAFAVMKDNTNGCGKQGTWPVCSRPSGATRQGLCDMAGNVWEWTEDTWNDSYNNASKDGSPVVTGSKKRVARGGSWYYGNAFNMRTTRRHKAPANARNINFGFRCARLLAGSKIKIASASTEIEASPKTASTAAAVLQPGTNLLWHRCALGQQWNGTSCSGKKKLLRWSVAKNACPTSYRLPTRTEWTAFLGSCDPAVQSGNAGFCNNCSDSNNCSTLFADDTERYWTATSLKNGFSWFVYLKNGRVATNQVPFDGRAVRCVKDGSSN